jgi:hypothetical protein
VVCPGPKGSMPSLSSTHFNGSHNCLFDSSHDHHVIQSEQIPHQKSRVASAKHTNIIHASSLNSLLLQTHLYKVSRYPMAETREHSLLTYSLPKASHISQQWVGQPASITGARQTCTSSKESGYCRRTSCVDSTSSTNTP